jgi:hypothetical protein
MSTYKDLKLNGIITSNTKYYSHEKKLILLDNFCQSLFGINKLPHPIIKANLIHENIVVKKKDNLYFDIDKINLFFKKIQKINFEEHSNCLPINYYNITNINEDSKSMLIFKFLLCFKSYLIEKASTESKKILAFLQRDSKNYFVGKFHHILIIESVWAMTVSFNNEVDDLIVNFGNDTENNVINVLDTSTEYLKEVYKYLKKEILIKTPDKFILKNLTRVTDNETFAKMILDSYNTKQECNISVNEINNYLQFKNDKSKKKYIEEFKELYKDSNIMNKDSNIMNKELYLNFEGFNKYLLNIDVKYLENFSIKEQINQMYTNILMELVDTYKLLYEKCSL